MYEEIIATNEDELVMGTTPFLMDFDSYYFLLGFPHVVSDSMHDASIFLSRQRVHSDHGQLHLELLKYFSYV